VSAPSTTFSQSVPTTMRAAVLVAPGEFRILEKRVPDFST
jgi:hypothetical protein